jgi:hypothetical protein
MFKALNSLFSRLFRKKSANNSPDYSKKLRFYNFEKFSDHKLFLDCVSLALDPSNTKLQDKVRLMLPKHVVRPIVKVLSESDIDFGVEHLFLYDTIAKQGNTCTIIECDGHYQMYIVGGAKRTGDLMIRFALYLGADQQLHVYIPQVGNSYDLVNNRAFRESEKLKDASEKLELNAERLVKASRSEYASVSAVIGSQIRSITGNNGFKWEDDACLGDLPYSIRSNLMIDYYAIDADIIKAFHLSSDVNTSTFHPDYKCDFNKSDCIEMIACWAMSAEDSFSNKCSVFDAKDMQDHKNWEKDSMNCGLVNCEGIWYYKQMFVMRKTDFRSEALIVTDHTGCVLKCFDFVIYNQTAIGEDKDEFKNITEESNGYTKSQEVLDQIHDKT